MIVTDLTHAGTPLCSSEEFKRSLIICHHLNPLSHTPDVTTVTNDTGVSFASLIAQLRFTVLSTASSPDLKAVLLTFHIPPGSSMLSHVFMMQRFSGCSCRCSCSILLHISVLRTNVAAALNVSQSTHLKQSCKASGLRLNLTCHTKGFCPWSAGAYIQVLYEEPRWGFGTALKAFLIILQLLAVLRVIALGYFRGGSPQFVLRKLFLHRFVEFPLSSLSQTSQLIAVPFWTQHNANPVPLTAPASYTR